MMESENEHAMAMRWRRIPDSNGQARAALAGNRVAVRYIPTRPTLLPQWRL